jgi:hypothetical protein
MATYNLNMADEKLIEQITNPEQLEPRIENYSGFLDHVKALETMHAESSTIGSFTHRSGFSKCKTFQRIASIPWSVACAIKEIDPGFFRDPVKVGKFLKKHPEYATTRIIK